MISTYNQVCPVMFGVDASTKLGEKAQEMGGTKAFLVYDKGIGATGIIERFVDDLNAHGVECVLYDGVLPDPPRELVDEAGVMAREAGVDMIIGIGGGSSLDTAKAVSILVENPSPINQYYARCGKAFEAKIPVILVPTASGTGSESTLIGVMNDSETMAKEFILRPGNLSIVDPKLTVSVPNFVTASTGLDAMSHALESLTSATANPKADLLSLHAIKLITKYLPIAYADGSNIEARTNLSLASNFAGIAFADASVHYGHGAAHEFGVQFHTPHGVACAYTLPEVIRFSADVIPEKTKEIAAAFGVDVTPEMTGVEAAELAAAKIRALMKEVGIPSLKESGISREDAIACAKGAVEKNFFVVFALKPMNEEVMAEQIALMYDNYQ